MESQLDLLSLTIRGPGHRFNHGLGISGLSGTQAILKVIKKHPSIAALDLGGNIALGDQIAPAISKMLLKNRSLTYLDLSDCSITLVSLPFLVDAVKKNKTLVRLVLDNITQEGLDQFKKAAEIRGAPLTISAKLISPMIINL